MALLDRPPTTLFVCVTCRAGRDDAQEPRPGAQLFESLRQGAEGLAVVPVECLSNCQRGCTAAVSAPGKWTYVIGQLDPEQHAADMLAFARLHREATDGLPAWRSRPEHVRKNTIARIPPLPVVAKEIA
ncbi:Predicted metal-binding protein [Enhydrobacter aerosaccus]|uniref:Predicted metal-binding protein n=1 Tax=Enhydrobacter aerosaccus TaxID=225324 RepID=A0A1T4NY79_9HYPH|nr:Predicted metal-binding protein [Enhydrobacter aerosaccus]